METYHCSKVNVILLTCFFMVIAILSLLDPMLHGSNLQGPELCLNIYKTYRHICITYYVPYVFLCSVCTVMLSMRKYDEYDEQLLLYRVCACILSMLSMCWYA